MGLYPPDGRAPLKYVDSEPETAFAPRMAQRLLVPLTTAVVKRLVIEGSPVFCLAPWPAT
jgi:hypothetical protein